MATSVATEDQARSLGIPVEDFDSLDRLDIAIDGTDEVTPDGWLIKGGGGAHLREKIVAAAAERFVVIADSSKPVEQLTWPVPLELFAFGLASTLARLGDDVTLRAGTPPSPDGGLIADYRGPGLDDPATLAARLEADPGVAAQGLFPPSLVSDLFVADRRRGRPHHLRLNLSASREADVGASATRPTKKDDRWGSTYLTRGQRRLRSRTAAPSTCC